MSLAPIKTPYLLFLGDAALQAAAKTATGIAHWRPEVCIGEFRYDDCTVTAGLPRLDIREALDAGAKTIVIGVANAGGIIRERWVETFEQALDAGLDVASGMHTRLDSIPRLASAAQRSGGELHDVRIPAITIPVGTGLPRSGRRILTVGTDCSVGKMFTALAIERELRSRGADASFCATGQTGILICGSGISVDAVVADFISGATELLAPAANDDHFDVIEGQGSLFHPSFAGVSIGLLHGAQAEALVMCHEPTRKHMRATEHQPIPDLVDCIRLNEECARLTQPNARVVGVAVNTAALDQEAAQRCIEEIAARTGLPSADPVRNGVGSIVDAIGV